MLRTGAPQLMGKINQTLILSLLHQKGALSRTDLARATGLTLPTISRQVSTLIDEGYVHEAHIGEAPLGKPPMMLEINHEGAYVAGLNITATYLEGALVNLGGKANHFNRQIIDVPEGAVDAILMRAVELVRPILDAAPQDRLLGLGVAVPGVVDTMRGEVVYSAGLKWEHVPLQALLEDALGVSVVIDSHMRARALGERFYGNAREVKNFLWVYVGMWGLGMAMILNGQVYHGANHGAGEIGHKLIDSGPHQPVCKFCGRRGCLSALTDARAVLRRAEDAVRANPDSLLARQAKLTIDIIRECAGQGDPAAQTVILETGRYLGMGLADIVNLLNPSHIYLGGSVTMLGPLFLDQIQQTVRKHILYTHSGVEIENSVLSRYASTVGAATLLFRTLFERPG